MSVYTNPQFNRQQSKKKPSVISRKYGKASWSYEETPPIELCKGVEIDSSVYEISENRYFTLILKGLIVYFITAGGIGSYLSALGISFNHIAFNFIVLITALVCAMLYHTWKTENLGYLVFFVILATWIYIFRDYINSGFYAVLNDTIYWASIFFDTEGLQYYTERVANRYAAITISMSTLGIAMNVLLNNYILRRARYMVAIGLAITVNLIAFYMHYEPNTIYTIFVLAGIAMTFMLKCGRHYHLSRRDHVFGHTKKGVSYMLDYKSLWQGMLTAFIYVLVVVTIMSTIYNKKYYDNEREQNEKKIASNEIMANVLTMGIFGLIDFYPNNGGLSTGELGGVSSIRLDYQTDLTVIYTPYANEMLYLKNFTGMEYEPFENRWTSENRKFQSTYSREVDALKEKFEEGNEFSAKGLLSVTNVEAPAQPYQPYYSEGDAKPVFNGQTATYTYYPRYMETGAYVEEYTPNPIYLSVPEENKEAVDKFIEEAGLEPGNPQEVAQQLMDYYEENIPYTIRPGATPWRQDFVNYFLEKNRKGYCAHFASAATLVFRELGIPARYCEGYALSFTQVLDQGEIVEGADYSSRYEGYNALGDTAVVRVDATDADAHAWVEIYDEKLGWIKVDVTPPSSINDEEIDEDAGFWDSFNNVFGDGDEDAGNVAGTNTNLNISKADTFMRFVAYIVIVLVILAIIGYILLKMYPTIKYHQDYKTAGLSDKLILKYSRYIDKLKKKDMKLRPMVNYDEQMAYLLPFSESERNTMVDILERAGFSNKEISQNEHNFANNILENIFRERRRKKQ